MLIGHCDGVVGLPAGLWMIKRSGFVSSGMTPRGRPGGRMPAYAAGLWPRPRRLRSIDRQQRAASCERIRTVMQIAGAQISYAGTIGTHEHA